MRKQLLFLLLMFLASKFSFAQVNKGKIKYKDYLIEVIGVPDNNYGYKIYKGEMLIVHANKNPYSKTKRGFFKKDNAIKMAKAFVEFLDQKQTAIPVIDESFAKKAGITEKDL